jgi:ATP-binding cassette subfamily G (WHITE) protein 2 (SNQ2)
LLKSLSNQHESFHAINGHVQYGAFTPKEIRQHYRGDVVYCPEDDVHFPTLTVGETIEFAARTRAPHTRFPKSVVDGECNVDEDVDVEKAAAEGGPRASRGMYVKAITQMLTTVFGLRHTVDTKVGGAALRGVSGGEKKRVSIAEALASRALLGSWDK